MGKKPKIELCPVCFLFYDTETCPGCDYMAPRKRCRDCGRFVSSEMWVQMTAENRKRNLAPLCYGCQSNYESPYDY